MTTSARAERPNHTLLAVRKSLGMTQEGFAEALREAGAKLGAKNDANKRLVQRWERGVTKTPQPIYRKALEAVTGRPISALGFQIPAFVQVEEELLPVTIPAPKPIMPASGPLSGIWLSKYKYVSSGRDGAELLGMHYVVLLQHGSSLSVQSLPKGSLNPDSPLWMTLEVDRHIVTGTWTEETAKDGYYRGAVYHGAIQMLVEPTGRRMEGKWVGFGKEFDVNTGPWELAFQTNDTSKAALAEYNRTPEA
ncbi:helix-turn-helix domain-containing protein [Streptomyces sp. NPDC058947]|uniref:helix-turn-helix domain-containing protein n=1 Tax=Streptomyces sp. NPDC058947 TaxID=3346675 RepID=UPI0036BEDAE8